MHVSTPLAGRAARWARGVLPHGQLLAPREWERRHRGIVVVLWLHVVGLALFGVSRRLGLVHCTVETGPLAAFALVAGQPSGNRRLRASAAVLGLVTASAVLVHLSGGTVEAHFHFFVVVGIITLYPDQGPVGSVP